MARNIYYAIKASGSTTHFHTLGAAKKAAKRIAKQSGRAVDIEKMSHAEYHRTGRASKGIVATVENAGYFSHRKTKKRLKAEGIKRIFKHGPAWKQRKPRKNPTVYDSSGKNLGKFSRKGAKIAARASGGKVGRSILFRTKEAMLKYASEHGLRVASIRKAPR